MAKNDPKKIFIVSVVSATLNRKGKLSLMTRLRLRKAVKLGRSFERSGISFRYAVVPSCVNPEVHAAVTQRLVSEIWVRHPEYPAEVITPERGGVLPKKADRLAFLAEQAKARRANFIAC